MAEYIEREALLKWAREFYPNDLQFASAVINAPAADVAEIRRGKWIDVDDGSIHKSFGAYSGRCSECKKFSGIWLINEPYKFCPNCGAKMDGGEK